MIQIASSFSLLSKDEWKRLDAHWVAMDKKKLKQLIHSHMIINEIKKDPTLLEEFKNKLNANSIEVKE